jgi:hypothetical protein
MNVQQLGPGPDTGPDPPNPRRWMLACEDEGTVSTLSTAAPSRSLGTKGAAEALSPPARIQSDVATSAATASRPTDVTALSKSLKRRHESVSDPVDSDRASSSRRLEPSQRGALTDEEESPAIDSKVTPAASIISTSDWISTNTLQNCSRVNVETASASNATGESTIDHVKDVADDNDESISRLGEDRQTHSLVFPMSDQPHPSKLELNTSTTVGDFPSTPDPIPSSLRDLGKFGTPLRKS